MNVLSVRNVKKTYTSKHSSRSFPALNGITFFVEEGEFTGIMGPSGAGKTTLLNVIATIDTVTSGRIQIGNQEITRMREQALSDFRRNSLGFIFQDYNLLDTLSIRDNIALPLVLSHCSAQQIETSVCQVADDLGIYSILKKYPSEVSGGQRQRAAAARALVHSPKLILADEPTGALDSKSSADLLSCMQQLNQKRRATILLVTHDAFAASFCQRILFIKDGVLFSELVNTGDRQHFYSQIIEVLSQIGGNLA
ncbi:MAG: ABC transporter ATP-binding protein [Christensenella sp.]|nr:ABC transporter ATP-binding protein [Christensenella sp.]